MSAKFLLFSLNNEGRVYSLSTSGSYWREFMYLGLEFKTLSAVPHFLWAVGGDRQVYVHVHGLEIPIRVKEEAYENERWLPLEGFSGRLLPTDRYHFSSVDGTIDRSIDKIRLPSMAWQWEGDWQLELTLDGQPLDHDGWSYAVDFPANFGATKKWKSCVRRRKWIRYRKYSAMNSWCAIAPLHKDPTQEPFIDISIGGNQVPHGSAGSLSVWAVTALGRVMFRAGVSTIAPEGLKWINVSTPPSTEVRKITVGPTGLVWALLWTGRALVRKGVTRDCVTGDSWLEVKSPDDIKLSLISVGYDSVWALSTDGRVWFRKGISGNGAGVSEAAAMGTGWLEVSGNMIYLSVACNDQVFAVAEVDKCVYWRSGVNPSELTGKRWRALQAPLQLSRTSSMASCASRSPGARHRSLSVLNKNLEEQITEQTVSGSWEESHSAPTQRTLPVKPLIALKKSIENSSNKPRHSSDSEPSEIMGKTFEMTLKNPRAWSPVHSVGSVVGMEAHPETDSSVFDGDCGLYCEDEIDQAAWEECNAIWTFVEAGGCILDPSQPPHWFAEVNSGPCIELEAEWRLDLIRQLKSRNKMDSSEISKYNQAVDDKSWSRSAEARQLFNNGSSEDCILSINWHSGDGLGTLSVFNPDGAKIKFILNLSEITCVTPSSEPGYPRITLFTPRRFKDPIKLQFSSETEYEEWLNMFVDILCQVNNISGKLSKESIWALTNLGDVLAWDSHAANACVEENGLFLKETTMLGKDATNGYQTVLHNNFSVCSELDIKGCIHDSVDRIIIDLQCPVARPKHKNKSGIDTKNVALHINPRFADGMVIFNSKLSNEWGDEERESHVPFLPGQEFSVKIVCLSDGFKILVNGESYKFYKHRLPPESITTLHILGGLKLYNIQYRSKSVIVVTDEMIWRLIGGHLRKVETCAAGVVWGISHDHTPWVYSGGWGGGVLKGLGDSKEGINSMQDTQNYFVYENQRWNPISGYTSSGLPTDRHMWSDITGRYKRTRELTKLLNRHWHWISEWIVDYNTPGGVDSDGWQYATDFPAPYHGKKLFTDCVRRRRWFRQAQLVTEGPWNRVGNTPIIDVALWCANDNPDFEDEFEVTVWAVSTAGDALFRNGVLPQFAAGMSWQHVSSPQPLNGISIHDGVLWAVGRKGEVYFRVGISKTNSTGNSWRMIEAPKYDGAKTPSGFGVRVASLSSHSAWVVLTTGQVAVRIGVTQKYPAGTNWKYIEDGELTFKHISAGATEVWALSLGGAMWRRVGISPEHPKGATWQPLLNANYTYISGRSNIY